MNRVFNILMSALLVSCGGHQVSVSQEFVFDEAPFLQCHGANIVETPEGELVVAFSGGDAEGADNFHIYQCRKSISSPDGWSAPELLVRDSLHASWNPVFFNAGEGRMLFYFKTGTNPENWVGQIAASVDGVHSLVDVQVLPDGSAGATRSKPIRTAQGLIICPSSDETDGWKVHFDVSDDEGRTWTVQAPVASADTIAAIQPAILVHKDGRLQTLCRTMNGRLAETWSTDGGMTWSELSLTDFPNNNSGLDAINLPDGRFLLVCNPVSKSPEEWSGPRTPLCAFISKDGTDWKKIATLEDEDGEFSYPSAIVGSDGAIHIVYTWKRERIRYARLVL